MEILVNKDEVILHILDFLKSQNYIKSLVALESETSLSTEDLPDEIKFFRDLILNGDFETAINFLDLFRKAERFPYNHCVFTIKHQQFLELVENNNENEVDTLVNLSKDIEILTTKEKYNELCYFLTLKKVSDHPDFANWNIYTGRMDCFNEIKSHLRKALFSNGPKEKEKVKPNSLVKLLAVLLRLLRNENKHSLSKLFDDENHFSLFNSEFLDIVDRTAPTLKVSLTSDESREQEAYKAMSKSIGFLRNTSNLADFRSFGQTVNFENMKFPLLDHYKQVEDQTPPREQRSQFKESQVSYQQAQPSNFEVKSDRKQQDFVSKSLTKSQLSQLEDQSYERQSQVMNKSPMRTSYNDQKFNQSSRSEKPFGEYGYQGYQASQDQDKFEQSSRSSTNRSINPLSKSREPQQLEDSKRFSRESPTGSQDEHKEDRIRSAKNSQVLEDSRGGRESPFGKGSKLSNSSDYDMYNNMEEIGQIQDVQAIRTASFSPDGNLFAIGTNSKSLKIYDIEHLFADKSDEAQNIELVFEKNNHHFGSIYAVDWSNTGKFIASGSNDKLIKVVKVPNFKTDVELMELKLPGHKGIVRSLAFTLDDTKLLSGSTDCMLKVWDVKEGMEIRTLQGHTGAIYCLQVSGDGNSCISVGVDKCLKFWDLRMHECSISIPVGNYAEMNYVSLRENTKNYSYIKNNEKRGGLSTSGLQSNTLAAVAHTDGVVTLWDISTRKLLKAEELHEADCRSVEFDASSGLIATSSFDSTIGIYDINGQKILNRIAKHTDRVVLAKWHPRYPVILSTSADTTARLFAPQKFLRQWN